MCLIQNRERSRVMEIPAVVPDSALLTCPFGQSGGGVVEQARSILCWRIKPHNPNCHPRFALLFDSVTAASIAHRSSIVRPSPSPTNDSLQLFSYSPYGSATRFPEFEYRSLQIPVTASVTWTSNPLATTHSATIRIIAPYSRKLLYFCRSPSSFRHARPSASGFGKR